MPSIQVKNPKTGRNINVGSPTFKKLLDDGYIYNEAKRKLFPSGECLLLSKIRVDELFIEIFRYLHPKDLLSLLFTCHTFYNILYNLENQTTQNIWKVSRLTFMPFLPSPRGIDEILYTYRASRGKCQFCNKKTSKVRPYWAFDVYSCRGCIKDHTDICIYQERALVGLPCEKVSEYDRVLRNQWSNRYWKEDVEAARKKYNELSSDEEKDKWYRQQAQEGREKMLDIKMRDMTNDRDPKTELNYVYENLIRCPSYKSACKNKLVITWESWKSLRNELVREYLLVPLN